ncbi:MAG: AbrB family transcriptional regulator [Rhodospirillaceae bacterium]|nr:AbrB family transcriptional regulator [Rhodospirillaceae bacterium]
MSTVPNQTPGAQSPPRAFRILLGLFIGATGGLLFYLLHMPLPWMIGAMVFSTIAAAAGAPIAFSFRLRTLMIVVLGVMLGSAFTPDLLAHIGAWTVSIVVMLLYVPVSTAIVHRYFVRVGRYDNVTAYFSAAPGGLTEMVVAGAQYGGDDRMISLSHGTRILMIVLIVSFGFRLFGGYQPSGASTIGEPLLTLAPFDLAVLAAAGLVGYLIVKPFKVPAGALVGPMLISAALHFFEVTSSRPPLELVAAAQIVIGSAIGARFAGTSHRTILRAIALSFGATVLLLGITALFAFGVAAITGLPIVQVLLGYAPGGIAEMSLIALSLGVDPAFVSTHHVARIFMIVLTAVPFFLLLGRIGRYRDRNRPVGPPDEQA